MAVRKLYGALDSPSTMRALASLFEHDVEFEFIPVDLQAGELKMKPSLSPFGELPVFQEEDLTIFESRTIMRYISHEYGKRGKEQVYEMPKLQGIAAAWIDVENHQFNPPASKLIWELVFKPQKGLPTDEGVVEEEEAKLLKVLEVYEERLNNSIFLGGDKFTSADLTHIPSLYLLMKTPVKRLFEERPRVRPGAGASCLGLAGQRWWRWLRKFELRELLKQLAGFFFLLFF